MEVENNKNDYYWKLLQKQIQEQRIEQVFAVFRENGFEPILLKGWAAARNYPKPYSRLSVDTDIAVSPSDFLECQKLIEQKKIVGVDLHCGLRHLDTLFWEDLFEHSQLVELNKTEVRILCPEDHLRVLCVHWLADGGVSKERLWDIVYLVKNRPPDFDWDRCLNTVSETRRDWIVCTIGLAVRYLGLDVEPTPLNNLLRDIPKWIIRTVVKEWESEIRLKPLQNCLGNRKEFFEQIYKRIPPNPIQATIEMEGRLDDKTRIFYQLGSILLRFKPSLKRISKTLWRSRVNKNLNIKSDEKEKRVNEIVLSIETSVEGGSMSLLENETELDFWQGSGSISRAEEILDELLGMLKRNRIEKKQIGRIVISKGPGSFTGTRIGLAIVLGLKKSLNCDIRGVSVLEAMALMIGKSWNNRIIAAIPIGIKICIQEFEIGQKRELEKITMPHLISFGEFIKRLEGDLESKFVLYERLYQDVLASMQKENRMIQKVVNSGGNLAYLIGLSKIKGFVSKDLQPIYVKHST